MKIGIYFPEASGTLRIPFSQDEMRRSGKSRFTFHLDWKCADGDFEFLAEIKKSPITTEPVQVFGIVFSGGIVPDGISDIPKTAKDVIEKAIADALKIPFFLLLSQNFITGKDTNVWRFYYEVPVDPSAKKTIFVDDARVQIRETGSELGFVSPDWSEILNAQWEIAVNHDGGESLFFEGYGNPASTGNGCDRLVMFGILKNGCRNGLWK